MPTSPEKETKCVSLCKTVHISDVLQCGTESALFVLVNTTTINSPANGMQFARTITPQERHAARIDARHGGWQVWRDGHYRTAGTIGQGTRQLTREELMHAAPSIFAEAKHDRTSARYSFLPTASILSGMEREGWVPTCVQEQRVRDHSRDGFQKHMIRFAHVDSLAIVGDRPEIVLINSHDRSSSYHLHAGIFRTYCLNGLVVCDGTFEHRSITHLGFEPAKVIEASVEIIRDVPRLMDGIGQMKALMLTDGERHAFAQAAVVARWEDPEKAPVRADKLLLAQRSQDVTPTLWNTLNVVQEHLMQGGQRDYGRRAANGRKLGKSRAVKGIDGNLGLNKALWTLAEEMRRLKA